MLKITTEYDGNQTTFHSDERASYGVHADNPTRTWMVRCTFTIYGKRAQSYKDVALVQPEPVQWADALARANAERAFAQAQLQAVLFFVTAFATVEVEG